MVDMTPTPDDVAIHLPITFDYHGGRNENKKGKIIAGILIGVITLIITIGVLFYQDIEMWQRFLISCVAFYIGLFIMRFFMEDSIICLIPMKQRKFLIVSLLQIILTSYMTVPEHQNLITG